ncbi:hypothetical protein L226DRAFT_333625 [Lentinus tigrinus ALCF2SS1-7]|uniref:uncharacterized protein n=1 Tax=Lentinus tigrinus ALCF2SS1-7 TaxID=1328758 RepID=UPI0011662465|nr:hypothetical protein L226DRAFT_333625 [Lentinus tigrinus ALCF2SS1-7]
MLVVRGWRARGSGDGIVWDVQEAYLGLASFSRLSLCKDEEFSVVFEEKDRKEEEGMQRVRSQRRKGKAGPGRGTKLIPAATNRQQKLGDKAWQHCFTLQQSGRTRSLQMRPPSRLSSPRYLVLDHKDISRVGTEIFTSGAYFAGFSGEPSSRACPTPSRELDIPTVEYRCQGQQKLS